MMSCARLNRVARAAAASASTYAVRPAMAVTAVASSGASAATASGAAPASVRLYSTSSHAVAAHAHASAMGAHASRRCICSACTGVAPRSCLPSVAAGASAAAASAAPRRCFSAHARKQPAGGATSAPRAAASPSNTPSRAATRTPTFNQVMKRFNLLVHPDLFGASPTHQHVNQESLQALNSLLSTLKTRDSKDLYPPKQVLQLVFHVKKRRGDERWAEYVRTVDLQMHLAGKGAARPASQQQSNSGGRRAPRSPRGESALPARGKDTLDGEFHVVPVIVSTNGGQCKKQVQEQLASMFYRCGLPHKFEWDEEYWNMGGVKAREDIVEEEYYEDQY